MWTRTVLLSAGAIMALVVSAGCSNSSDTSAEKSSTSASATAAPATAQNAGAHNDADVMFAQHMIPHHQQAIEMSDMVLGKQGIDPRVTELANQIKAAQGPEIQQMQGWLTQWGNPPMPSMPAANMPGHNMPAMSGMPSTAGMSGMSGMMSDADMAALQNAQGVEASKLFLTQMITHHEGAITMAQNEIRNGQFADAVALAKSIATSQQKEIDTMNQILSSL